jgi:hypothetical protein
MNLRLPLPVPVTDVRDVWDWLVIGCTTVTLVATLVPIALSIRADRRIARSRQNAFKLDILIEICSHNLPGSVQVLQEPLSSRRPRSAKMTTVSTIPHSGTMSCCDRHQLYRVTDIGRWLHRTGPQHLVPVSVWAEKGGIWLPGHHRLSHDDLTSGIRDAGGVECGRALTARPLPDGTVELVDGMHRWSVCTELGVEMVPVKMEEPLGPDPEPGTPWMLT